MCLQYDYFAPSWVVEHMKVERGKKRKMFIGIGSFPVTFFRLCNAVLIQLIVNKISDDWI